MTENDPFARLPRVSAFHVSSKRFAAGDVLRPAQRSGVFGVEGGEDRSPQLSWSGAPESTKSYVVTVFDPDGRASEFVPLPDIGITNIAFGGADRRDAYITASTTGTLCRVRWPRPGARLH